MIEHNKCTGCTACANICPKSCISMCEDREGFLYPLIEEKYCIKCNLCEKVCPVIIEQEKSQDSYTVCIQNQNETIRKVSTAGGFVGAIFSEIFCNNGIAYGAGVDENHLPYHTAVRTIEECMEKHIFGSKYVSSSLNNTFLEIRRQLDSNVEVCFVGLPCQVAGLKAYLQKQYKNLFTIDLTCYGVPSTKLYREYLEYIEKIYKSKIKQVSFRDKIFGYSSPTMSIEFENGKIISQTSSIKTFLRCFFMNISIRPSCYNCNFKGVERISDLTIGDCKSIGKFIPEMDDDKGTTVVYIHTSKGEKLLERVSDQLRIGAVDLESILKVSGKKMIECPSIPKNRSSFFIDMEIMEYKKLVNKYCPAEKSEKVANITKTIVLMLGLNNRGIMKKIKELEKRFMKHGEKK